MPGENLDLSSGHEFSRSSSGAAGRPFVGIRFACCDIYTRIYINKQQTAYQGACPRCARPLELKIGPGGTDARFFTAY